MSVQYAVEGSVATLTLDEPRNRNAITPELLAGIADGLAAAEADERVRALVLAHTGTTFCAGADLSRRPGQDTEGVTGAEAGQGSESPSGPGDAQAAMRERGRASQAVNRALLASPLPVIAALDGHVRAGGMGLVACCDIVIAGPRSTFGLSEVRIGVVAAMIAAPVLARLGDRTAADWMLRGGPVGAAEAATAGFITRAVDGAEVSVTAAVDEVVADLLRGAPKAIAASKALVNRSALAAVDERGEDLVALSAEFFTGADAQAGLAAFARKADPPWAAGRS
ncbi:enoyl-CoA hydratase-related protein [Brevibacterium sp. BRM-1]|uniref:enoyl-CoA hydratase-related protein n=1 Tax=Brevibacterium sp. BRM-1 TaxID=2999062 RepID=UPI00228305B1|nr:enoyl-CoA hydratase-related protein [Brevibacterium sp. BRM-1]WAL40644.1 enoyl-CoA hydratase-related protein [Brevibacterium sp. BRM-1]